jgi:hypothetical protein
VNVSTPALITAYLLGRLVGTAPILLIITMIAVPMVWSRDAKRRARAYDTLRLLTLLLTGRRTR